MPSRLSSRGASGLPFVIILRRVCHRLFRGVKNLVRRPKNGFGFCAYEFEIPTHHQWFISMIRPKLRKQGGIAPERLLQALEQIDWQLFLRAPTSFSSPLSQLLGCDHDQFKPFALPQLRVQHRLELLKAFLGLPVAIFDAHRQNGYTADFGGKLLARAINVTGPEGGGFGRARFSEKATATEQC